MNSLQETSKHKTMKKDYIKPSTEEIVCDANTVMMAESSVDTGVGDTPSHPDANGRRGTWGSLWE